MRKTWPFARTIRSAGRRLALGLSRILSQYSPSNSYSALVSIFGRCWRRNVPNEVSIISQRSKPVWLSSLQLLCPFATDSGMNPPRHDHGNIQLIFGPMFCGKSTELIRRIRRSTVAKQRCLLIKYAKDTRYDEEAAATHDKVTHAALPCTLLAEAVEAAKDMDVIGIDEGQFFPDLVEHCEQWANEGRTVIVAALDGTFQRKPFGRVLELVPLAEEVTKLKAVCMLCQGEAAFSKRLGSETTVELIGGADKYIAVCRTCYHKEAGK